MKVRKTKKANLENKRTLFFQIGFVVSLSLVLLAFEWTTIRSNEKIVILDDGLKMESEFHKVEWKKEKKEVPKVKVPKAIEIVDNTDEVGDEDLDISSEIDENTENGDSYIPDTEEEDDSDGPMFVPIPEVMPEYPGGLAAMHKFIKENLKYPQMAKEARVEGPVYVQFVVYNDGSLKDIEVIRGIGSGCDEEAERVVKLMKNWIPGSQMMKSVNVPMVLPIIYKLN